MTDDQVTPSLSICLSRQAERELARLVRQMDMLAAEKKALEAALADPDLYRRDPEDFQMKTDRLTALQTRLNAAEERWLVLEMDLEATDS